MSQLDEASSKGASGTLRVDDNGVIDGAYRLLRRLGGGSMGEIYEAEHVRLGKVVAFKLLRAEVLESPRIVQRFRREAAMLARIRSEHVVSVLDCGDLEDGRPYLVLERLQGEDLRTLLSRGGALAPRRAVHLAIDVCRGLRAVHQSGLVHRDLKPANLFVAQRDSGEDLCKILDFGVAKLPTSEVTSQGAVIGTVRYMAPEQLADGASTDARADIYALGAILYECLSAAPMHEATTVQELMFRILNHDPQPLSVRCPELAPELSRVVQRATARHPDERFQNVDEMLEALSAVMILAGTRGVGDATLEDVAVPHSAVPKSGKPVSPGRRFKRAAPWGGLLLGGLLLGGFPAGWVLGVRAGERAVAHAPVLAPTLSRLKERERLAQPEAPGAGACLPEQPEPPVAYTADGGRSSSLSKGRALSQVSNLLSTENAVPVPARKMPARSVVRRTVPTADPPPEKASEHEPRLDFDAENPYAQ